MPRQADQALTIIDASIPSRSQCRSPKLKGSSCSLETGSLTVGDAKASRGTGPSDDSYFVFGFPDTNPEMSGLDTALSYFVEPIISNTVAGPTCVYLLKYSAPATSMKITAFQFPQIQSSNSQ